MKKTIILLGILILITAVLIETTRPIPTPFPCKYIAHKSDTFARLDEAASKGYNCVEIDISATKNTVIISHSAELNSTKGLVDICTAENLNELQLNGEPIHTLEQVFKKYGKQFHYHLDYKDYGCNSLKRLREIERLIIQNDLQENAAVESRRLFDIITLGQTRIRTMYWAPRHPDSEIILSLATFGLKLLGVDAIDLDSKYLHEKEIKKLSKNFEVFVFTVNNQTQAEKYFELGAHHVLTDSLS